MTSATAPEPRIDSAFLRPLTTADILDGMFELLTANWRAYAVALGVILVPLNFAISYLSSELYGGTGLLEMLGNPAAAEALAAGGPRLRPFIGLLGVSGIAFLVAVPFLNGAACLIAATGYAHESAAPGNVLRATARRYPALLGVSVLAVLAVVAVFALPALVIVAAAALDDNALRALAVLLIIATVPLAIMAVIRFSLSFVVVMVEHAGPWRALRRSWRLANGRFWRMFGTLTLTGIVAGVVAQIISLPFSLPGTLFGDWVGIAFSTIGGVVAAVFSTPLSANVQTLLYYDGRVRTEAYDLDVVSRDLLAPPEPGVA